MRKINFLLLFIFLGALMSCDQNNLDDTDSLEIGAKNNQQMLTSKIVDNYSGEIATCGLSTYDFKAGRNSMDAGTVQVSYDENYLYVKVTSTAGFQGVAENVKMWIGRNLDDLPTSGGGAPVNGQFPFKATVTGDTHVFRIALSEIDGGLDCDDAFYVVVHGDVLVEYNGQTSAQTAYAGDQEGEGNRWWWYMEETVECCKEMSYGWFYKEGSPGRVTCFEDSEDVFGFSNRFPYGGNYTRNGGVSYPIYGNVNINCDLSEIITVGSINVLILDYTDEENARIQLKLEMEPGYTAKDWKVYVGWLNPIIAGEFDSNLISATDLITVDGQTYEYIIHVKDWSGIRGDGGVASGLDQFFITSKITY